MTDALRDLTRDEAARLDAAIPDRDWTELPEGVAPCRFAVDGGELAGLVAGEPINPRILLVPGVTGSKEDFALMMPLLAAAGYFVESFDLAGQYESAGVDHGGGYTYEGYVADLIRVIESGSAPVHLLGYSFASAVCQEVAVRRPDLVASLTILSGAPLSGNAFRGVKRIGWLLPLGTPQMGAAVMIWAVRNNLNRVAPGRVEFVRHRFGSTRRESVAAIIGMMMASVDHTAALRARGIPIMVSAGEHDLWPRTQHQDFATALGARLAIYDGGHSPCETNPYELSLDLVELIESASR